MNDCSHASAWFSSIGTWAQKIPSTKTFSSFFPSKPSWQTLCLCAGISFFSYIFYVYKCQRDKEVQELRKQINTLETQANAIAKENECQKQCSNSSTQTEESNQTPPLPESPLPPRSPLSKKIRRTHSGEDFRKKKQTKLQRCNSTPDFHEKFTHFSELYFRREDEIKKLQEECQRLKNIITLDEKLIASFFNSSTLNNSEEFSKLKNNYSDLQQQYEKLENNYKLLREVNNLLEKTKDAQDTELLNLTEKFKYFKTYKDLAQDYQQFAEESQACAEGYEILINILKRKCNCIQWEKD